MLYNSLKLITFSFILASLLHANIAHAQSNPLAMHGQAKHAGTDKHLSYANPDAPKGGHLKMAASKGTFDTLNPFALKGTAADGLSLVYDRLMARRWDEPFTMYPLIAQRVTIPENRSAITFDLNPDARFNDGTPITTDDVIFSFETLKEHGRPNMRRIYKIVSATVKHNAHSLTFTLGDGFDRETVMILSMMPVLSKAYWEGKDFEATLLESPITSGPYTITKIDAGRSITYQRNADYWAKDLLANVGHYNFDEVTYEYFRDDTVALEAFNKGDLNFRREYDASKWASAYKNSADIVKYEPAHKRPERARGFIFNTRRAPFDDINVRKALSLAFDEDWIGKNIYHGEQKRIHSLFQNSSLAAPQSKTAPQSIREKIKAARDLLTASGWEVIDGKLIKDGQPLTFELIMNAPQEEKIALNLKKHLQRLGIVMNIRVLDSAAFQKRRQTYDYDMILHHWQNSLSPGTEQTLYWSCEAAEQEGRFNYAGICDPKIDALASKIANAQSYSALTKTAHTLDRALMDAHIIIPFFYSGKDKIAHENTLKHAPHVPIYGSVVETWWMEKPAQ